MTVPSEIVQRIRCPTCADRVDECDDGLICPTGHLLPMTDGYVDARVPATLDDESTRRTAASFGYEWNTFDSVQPEDAEFWKLYTRDLPPAVYAGKVALDAGCGKGRYTQFIALEARALAAVDNSSAVQAAARNLADRPNVAVLRADVRTLPFARESFDFIACLGVLHHLSQPEDGFRRLVELLRPGGHVLIYLYSRARGRGMRAAGLAVASAARKLTVRMPLRSLRLLSLPLAGLLYGAVVLPGRLGERFAIRSLNRFPLATYRSRPVRSLFLDTFDRLSAPIEHRFEAAEVRGWCERAGVSVLALREEAGHFLVGAKPQREDS